MILLDATTKILELATTAAVSTDYYVSYADITTTTFAPASGDGNVSTATTTTILAAPASSTQRQVKYLAVTNRHATTAQGITVKLDVSGTERTLFACSLQAGEQLCYSDGQGFKVYTAAGQEKKADTQATFYNGYPVTIFKIGTAPEAAGQWYSWAKDSGMPGAWAPGAPGLAGRATDGTTANDGGCLTIKNAASGANYLTSFDVSATTVCQVNLIDILWVNSGLVVTTLTAQTINSAAFPARDINGSTNGEDVEFGILVTTATTNAGAITNTTASYTDSDGNAGATATIASFPATAVIGTIVPFQLAAGDKGVRSIQTVTLGTSYVAGAISLIAFRRLTPKPITLANGGTQTPNIPSPGVRLYNGVCALPIGLMSAATATTINGVVTIAEK